ncbi:hypothetical protein [Dactylosporangium sp. NPDC048998]|uniref:hypothetical protein n=1 Tax=Dactylosporangium sp. NPDC048998 TaxID=3363976 RepID=UPI0037130771
MPTQVHVLLAVFCALLAVASGIVGWRISAGSVRARPDAAGAPHRQRLARDAARIVYAVGAVFLVLAGFILVSGDRTVLVTALVLVPVAMVLAVLGTIAIIRAVKAQRDTAGR